jgi:hypothetical protein
MRVTVLGGVVALVYQQTGMFKVVVSGGADQRQQMGFFLAAMPPLPFAPNLVIVPELSLSQVGVYLANTHSSQMHGVGEVHAQVLPDPQRGGQPGVYLAFTAVGVEAMALRYRVTLYRPRP